MTLKSWDDVDRLTDYLKAIADWQDELRSKIARARLRFELTDSIHASKKSLKPRSKSSSESVALCCGVLSTPRRRHE